MKALLLAKPKRLPQLSDVDAPVAKDDETIVTLKAAALNRRDYWISQGLYPGVQTPCILGSDGAGVVGDREVILCPGLDWGANEAAQQSSFRILGMPDDGTFAEQVALPSNLVFDKPAHLSWPEAAALPLGGLTAYRALMTQGQLQSGQLVLITGIGGGVSTLALQFALAAGARVVVTSSSEQKISRAVNMGALTGANYRQENWARELRDKHGQVDLVIDSAGGPGYNEVIGLVKPGGRIVNYGATAGPPQNLDMFKLFWNQIHITGSTMGSPQDFANMLKLVSEHQIHPVVDRIAPLSEGAALIDSMGRMSQFGKMVLEIA